jgi:hypothetical protein
MTRVGVDDFAEKNFCSDGNDFCRWHDLLEATSSPPVTAAGT